MSVPLGTGRRERALVAALSATAAAALAAWLRSHQWLPPHAGLLLVAAASGAVAGWWLLRPLQGQLRWDGAAWSHRTHAAAPEQPLRELRLQCDLGNWLLLHAHATRHADGGWCGLTRGEAGPAAWHGLRLALYHRRGPEATGAGLS